MTVSKSEIADILPTNSVAGTTVLLDRELLSSKPIGLRREVHSVEHLSKARVRAKAIPPRIDFEQQQPRIAILIRFCEPDKRLILLSQDSMDQGDVAGLYIAVLGQIHQF